MKIGTRLILGFGLLILITVITGSFALFQIKNLANVTMEMYQHPLTVSNSLRDIKINIMTIDSLFSDVENISDTVEADSKTVLIAKYQEKVDIYFELVLKNFLGDKNLVRYTKKFFDDWIPLQKKIIELHLQKNHENLINTATIVSKQHLDSLLNGVDELLDFAGNKAADLLAKAEKKNRQINYIMIGLLLVLILVSVAISFATTRNIVIPLQTINKTIESLSTGNLNGKANIFRKDEIGTLANSFRKLQKDLSLRAQLLTQIASGDFSTDIPPRSENDELGEAFFAMTSSLKKTKGELVHSELKYTDLTESVPIGISVTTQEGKVIEANSAIIKMFGFESRREFMLYPAIEYYYNPEDRTRLIKSLKKGQVKNLRLKAKKKDGTFFWGALTSSSQETEKYGTLFINSFMDISDLIKTEEILHKEVSYVKLLQKIAITANNTSKTEEALQVCLDEVCTIMDWPIGHVYTPLSDKKELLIPTGIWHTEDPEKFRSFMEATRISSFKPGIGLPGKILRTKQPLWITNVMNDPDFKRKDLVKELGVKAAFAFPVLLKNEVISVLEFFAKTEADPDEKFLEVMANIGQQLGRVEERARAKEKLKETAIEAESSNKAKSIFLANMSHELRTPLNAILGFSQVLQLDKEKLNSQQLENISFIKESGEHLLEMVNDILDLSKIESGKIDLKKQPFNPEIMIKRSLETVKVLLMEKNIKLEVDIAPNLGLIDADEKRIKEVLYNLLSNAIKFTQQEKKIGISTYTKDENIIIEIWDQGRGIEPEDMEKIFNPFEQVGKAKVGTNKGTGLGLAISKKLVEAHNGTLTVKSLYGQGSLFTVTLPGIAAEDRIIHSI